MINFKPAGVAANSFLGRSVVGHLAILSKLAVKAGLIVKARLDVNLSGENARIPICV
jgi:hypothetical protein